jgi:hypothetical protein
MRQALRVANIPEAESEALIESDHVPTGSRLAERRKSRTLGALVRKRAGAEG